MIKVAFATGLHGEFGLDGGFPWKRMFKVDMDEFKKFTTDTTLVMGSKTFRTLPSKLRGLRHIVLSTRVFADHIVAKDGSTPDLILGTDDIQKLLLKIDASEGNDICVIGGKSLVESVLPFADVVLHTTISPMHCDSNKFPECDTFIDSVYVDYSSDHIAMGLGFNVDTESYTGKNGEQFQVSVCSFFADKEFRDDHFKYGIL